MARKPLLDYNDVYLCFPFDIEEGVHASVPSFRFRAKDYIDFAQSKEEIASIGYNTIEALTIITPTVHTFHEGDIVKSVKDGAYWRVERYVLSDDNNDKKYSARPSKDTILTLVRSEVGL